MLQVLMEKATGEEMKGRVWLEDEAWVIWIDIYV